LIQVLQNELNVLAFCAIVLCDFRAYHHAMSAGMIVESSFYGTDSHLKPNLQGTPTPTASKNRASNCELCLHRSLLSSTAVVH